MSEKLSELIRLLDIEKVEENLFIANHPEGRTGRLYGGQIMAQCLIAGYQTVEHRPSQPRLVARVQRTDFPR